MEIVLVSCCKRDKDEIRFIQDVVNCQTIGNYTLPCLKQISFPSALSSDTYWFTVLHGDWVR